MIQLGVVVVGGGPGGLSAALALSRACPSLHIKVFEGSRNMAQKGAGVLLHVNGWRALEAIKPEMSQRLYKDAIVVRDRCEHHVDGTPVQRSSSGPPPDTFGMIEKEYGHRPKLISWHEVRMGIADELPEGTIELGHKFKRYEVLDDGDISVTFSTGDGEKTVKTNHLIGADGYCSAVREQTLGDGPPAFAGMVNWRARIEATQGDESPTDWLFKQDPEFRTAHVFKNQERNPITTSRAALLPVGKATLVWSLAAPLSDIEESGISFDPSSQTWSTSSVQDLRSTAGAKDRCLSVFGSFSDDVLSIVRATPPEGVSEHGIYVRKPETMPPDSWGVGNVSLVGDAAHCAPPDGQGLNLAVEDAAVLGLLAKKAGGLTAEVLRVFERLRIPRIKAIMSFTDGHPKRVKLLGENVVAPLVDAVAPIAGSMAMYA